MDNGASVSMPVDSYVRISCDAGDHTVQVIMKSSSEDQHRWHEPIEAKTVLLGIEADEFLELSPDNRKTIEFIGDSITEGISIDVDEGCYYGNEYSMVDFDDSTAGYAWLTAKALNLRPYIMGYGWLGITNYGGGGIPPVIQSYAFYSENCPMKSVDADYIVINHGSNDRKSNKELFKKCYYDFLKLVRERNPKSKIIALTPFSGCLALEIKAVVDKYNLECSDNVFYIDSTGWVTPEPLHPNREGHRIISEKLSEIMKKNNMY